MKELNELTTLKEYIKQLEQIRVYYEKVIDDQKQQIEEAKQLNYETMNSLYTVEKLLHRRIEIRDEKIKKLEAENKKCQESSNIDPKDLQYIIDCLEVDKLDYPYNIKCERIIAKLRGDKRG